MMVAFKKKKKKKKKEKFGALGTELKSLGRIVTHAIKEFLKFSENTKETCELISSES